MKPYLNQCCRLVMRPIIRMLLRNGVTYKSFSDLIKNMFVEVAAEDYGINGRQTNTTRIAILTGLDRKTIKQIRDDSSTDKPAAAAENTDKITRVLSGWHTDTDFITADKTPKILSLNSEAPNLRTLLLRYGGDVQPTAMLKELKRAGVVFPHLQVGKLSKHLQSRFPLQCTHQF